MCLSIPMRVVEWDDDEGFFAWVERGEGDTLRRERVNMMLIGPQEVGTWILASLGLAKETVDEENPEKVLWVAHRNVLYNQLTRWIGWFNFRDWDIMPMYWFNATPPDQMAEREERETKRASERASALKTLSEAIPALKEALPERDPYEWFEDCGLLPELTDEEREARAKEIKNRPKLEDQE